MSDSIINAFTKGTWNLGDDENIPKDSAQASSNWITQDGRLKLVNGKILVGAEGGAGKITGLHFGYKVDGSKVLYRKISTKIQYLNGSTWTDCVTGLTADSDYTFSNYSSLAGAFTYATGVDGIWKFINSHPTSVINMTDSSKNFKGYSMIDKGRMLLWNRPEDKTGLYGSYIDRQRVGVTYTSVTNEVLASGDGSKVTFTGTLAFKSGGATRNCFGLVVTDGVETFTDNYLGVLTGSLGGTGTINYSTGAYSVTFNTAPANTADIVKGSYTWEDSNIKGITDFSYSSTRLASEGFQIPQDVGGDAIQSVLVGIDGAYYSLKSQSAYKFTMDDTDLVPENIVYRRELGLPFFRAAISTKKGIVFLNTSNPSDPQLTILKRNDIGTDVEPYALLTHFDFSKYTYSDCSIDTYDRYITIACRTKDSTFNNVILLCDLQTETVDETKYSTRMFTQSNGDLYIGSALSESVYKVYNGYDDDETNIDNEWVSKGEGYEAIGIAESLKKFKKIRIKGAIDPDQELEVYISYDDDDFQLVGTIVGNGSYVDYSSPQSVGSNVVGTEQIGGSDIVTVYPFYAELKLTKTPKFRKRTIKLVATGIGYLEVESLMDYNILIFEKRIPKRFRSKQNVSLDGHTTDIPEAELTGSEPNLLITEDDSFIEL